jgi:hypothetical protein
MRRDRLPQRKKRRLCGFLSEEGDYLRKWPWCREDVLLVLLLNS